MNDWRAFSLGMTAGAMLAVLLAVGASLIVVYGGFYNIAATEAHTALVRWGFDTTFRNSVLRHAADTKAPPAPTPQQIAAGAGAYKSMCQHCHAGPGVERSPWASGMRPQPPHLTEAAANWSAQEIFWLVKHGAKMTGMPAFGPSHADGELAGIAAFVKSLPSMTPETYAAAGGDLAGAGHDTGGNPPGHHDAGANAPGPAGAAKGSGGRER